MPIRLKTLHIINATPLIEKIMSVVKPLMSSEVADAVKIHMENSNTIFDFLSRDFLPSEYGGNAASLDETKKIMGKTLRERRDYLMDPDYWTPRNK